MTSGVIIIMPERNRVTLSQRDNVYAFNTDAITLYEKMGYQIVLHRMSKKLMWNL